MRHQLNNQEKIEFCVAVDSSKKNENREISWKTFETNNISSCKNLWDEWKKSGKFVENSLQPQISKKGTSIGIALSCKVK